MKICPGHFKFSNAEAKFCGICYGKLFDSVCESPDLINDMNVDIFIHDDKFYSFETANIDEKFPKFQLVRIRFELDFRIS